MKPYKTMAHTHSLDGEIDEITVLEQRQDGSYIVDYKGTKCVARFNYFVCMYYADDLYEKIQ